MAQIFFGAQTSPQEPDLDSNFSELYPLLAAITPSGASASVAGHLTVGQVPIGLLNSNGFSMDPGSYMTANHASGTVTGSGYMVFGYNGGLIGSITQSGTTGVAYNTTSDYRLKTSVTPLTSSGAFIDALQPCTWTWISDGSPGAGFIAHQLQAVSPSSVIGVKDAVDANGRPVYQAVGYGSPELVANLVAEVKALRARLHALDGL